MKPVVALFLAAIAVLAALALWLRWMEPRMTYYPLRELEATPAGPGWSFEEVRLTASDAVALHGWFLPSPARHPGGPVVLFLHGNAGNISHRLEKLSILRDAGADVLIVDYRGYGRSQGVPSEPGLQRDARAAYDHLVEARGVPPSRVVLYGESLGSAVAARLAAQAEVAGVVLESAFTSAADVGQAMLPFLPVRWLLLGRYDTLGAVRGIAAPILVLHAEDDEYFPMRHAQRLVAAAGGRARLVVLRGGHNQAFLRSEEAYRRALSEFLAASVKAPE